MYSIFHQDIKNIIPLLTSLLLFLKMALKCTEEILLSRIPPKAYG
jgi:hypothetical protein